MAKSPNRAAFSSLSDALERGTGMLGLQLFGTFRVDEKDCPFGQEEKAGRTGVMIGNAGRSMWPVFSESSEYQDGDPDSLDRWSKRVVDQLAAEVGGEAIYPFSKPYWAFQLFAERATGAKQSPLGILIHSQYGLWHGFRGAILLETDDEAEFENDTGTRSDFHPCDSCKDKPCLTACPVGAFSGSSLNVKACFRHLSSRSQPDCMLVGCQAREACPYAENYRYESAQVRFHMDAYYKR